MPSYSAPVDEVLFLLSDVLHWDRHSNLPGFGEADLATVEIVLREAAKLCEQAFQPINLTGDREGCRRNPDGSVTTPAGFKEAYRAYAQGGWVGLSADSAWGGQGLPYTVASIVNEFAAAANMSLTMYPGLTQSAIAAVNAHASQELKQLYLPKMVAGEWSGTMNLTEPQCGTDLGLITTQAIEDGRGAYRLHGTKIFISAGEHDLCENIVHLVLARIEGAPPGTKGLSLFLVPKFEARPDGSLGERNTLSCGSIEHKMGIHGNATCVMNYDGARGWLVGEANRGLAAMFVMMNEARLGVASQGLAQSEVAYQNAARYARERLQGRALGRRGANGRADPIIVHPDVRRMLLSIRAFNEAARALLAYASLQADVARVSADPAEKLHAEDRLGLLTPVLKGVLTDRGFDNAVLAQQVFGGHGYVAEHGMEQFVRDARITMIYEGANGVQALDLVGRKVPRDGGRAIRSFLDEIDASLSDAPEQELEPIRLAVKESLEHIRQASFWLLENGLANPDNAAAGSYDYMHLLGGVALGYMWLRIAKAALLRKSAGVEAPELDAKLRLAKFYCGRMLPETGLRLARIRCGAQDLMSIPAEVF